MGYFTYLVSKDATVDRLASKVKANLALYDPGTVGSTTTVETRPRARMLRDDLGPFKQEEYLFAPIGYQFGGI